MKNNRLWNRLRRNLALLLCGVMMFSVIGMVYAEETPPAGTSTISGGGTSGGDVSGGDVSGGDSGGGSESGPTVALRTLDIKSGMSKISDNNREMPQEYLLDGSAVLTEDRVLPANLDKLAPAIEGWTFQGWYTAPVKYAFWGDKSGTKYQETEPLPFSVDCDGNAYNYTVDKEKYPNAIHSMTGYWYWLSTLASEGRKVNPGDQLKEEETALYALYKPVTITYKLDYNGWNRNTGVLSCDRQCGTPFGGNDVDENGWSGYVFDGWYPEGGSEQMSFYSIPQNGTRYVAHWHSTDGKITWENYKDQGYTNVTSVTMKDGSVGGGRVLGETLPLYACAKNSRTIDVAVSPADSGVTKLNWSVTGDTDVVSLDVRSNGMRAIVTATGKVGKATITVASGNGCSDSVTVDTSEHAFDKSEVTKWGNCKEPTHIIYTCVYCGKTKTEDSLKKHDYAYRDVPATCTEPHKWVHYCKVCGALDPANDMIREPAKGHDFNIFQAVGCGGTTTTKICQTCGYTEVNSDPNAASHSWSNEYTIDKRPTCNSEGSQSIKCLSCGATKPDSSVVIAPDPSLHVWSPWIVEEEATETEAGSQSRTCSVCGMTDTRAIPPTSYKVDDDAITGDMTVNGSDQLADQAQADAAILNTLNMLLKNGSLLGEDIRFAAILRQRLSTEIRVTTVASPENAGDAGKFNTILGDGSTVHYMDIDIFVKAGNENIGRITQTAGTMTFGVKLPAGGRIIRVLRAHEGTVEAIPSWVEGDMVYFSTDKFSTFAVSACNDISAAMADAIPDQTYSGSEKRPAVRLTINGGQTLTEGVDYSLSYKDNVNEGTASVVITGMGAFAGSSKTVNFNIVKSGSGNNGGHNNSAPSDSVWNSRVDVNWNAASAALDKAAEGSNVSVSTGTEFVIPVSIQNRVAKDNVTLACHPAGTDITVTLSSYNVKAAKQDITFSVTNKADIPAAASKEVTDTALFSRVLNIGQKSFFPQKLDVHMALGAQYAGRLAVMYSYDEITGSMRYESSFRITEEGLAMFPLQRGDEYIIVVTDSIVRKTATAAGNYRVAAGDTLSRIAAKNGITLTDLLKANPQIRNRNRIHIGDMIAIPNR